ncbi:MAG: ferrous iron transport protein B [Candidatus Alkanophagales archaeon]
MSREILVALAGNPNVGKSTLFNLLTGLRQHVGNWPGKTVERREGVCKHEGRTLRIIDLPGTYSLTAYSEEELIARDFIVKDRPDVVIDVVDASNLERNLYLTLQLLELTDRVVVALNMMDVAASKGVEIDVRRLSEILGVPVVPIVADRGLGVDALLRAAVAVAEGATKTRPYKTDFGTHIERQIGELETLLAGEGEEGLRLESELEYPRRWFAIKLLENDPVVVAAARRLSVGDELLRRLEELRSAEIHHNFEIELVDKRYEQISRIVKEVLRRREGAPGRELTDKIDRIVTHGIWGLPILFGIYGFVFWATFFLSRPLVDALEAAFTRLGTLIAAEAADAPAWLVGMLVDGVIGGVGTVLSFLPVIAIFFLLYAVLEDWGYMARAAFVMDKFMHAVGLHGRAFLCLLCGFGCNVPAIMAARTLADSREKLITILINPLVPCSVRLGVLAFITSVFFSGALATAVVLSLVALSLLLVAVSALLLRRLLLRGEHPPFIMEMPPYRTPTVRNVLLYAWERIKAFVVRAGTLIVVVSVVMWWLTSTAPGDAFGVGGAPLEESYAARIGMLFEPLGRLCGFDWRVVVALMFGFLAKELSVATLGVLYGGGEEALGAVLPSAWSPLLAYTFLAVHMIYVPCVATVATMRKETNSWRWTLLGVVYSLALAFLVGVLIYNAGRLLLRLL